MHLRIVDICTVCGELCSQNGHVDETLTFIILGRGLEETTKQNVHVNKVDRLSGALFASYETECSRYVGRHGDWEAALVVAKRRYPSASVSQDVSEEDAPKGSEELEVIVTGEGGDPGGGRADRADERLSDVHSIPFPDLGPPGECRRA